MLFSCQHSLAHGTLSPPRLCFPPVSQGSSQVLPCQALPMAPAPLELVPAPVPAHRHFFKLMTAAKRSPAAFKGVNASLPMWDASLWILGEPGWFLQSRTRVAIHPHPGIDETIQLLVIHWQILLAKVLFIRVSSLVFHCPSQLSVLFSFIPFLTLSPLHITYPKAFLCPWQWI